MSDSEYFIMPRRLGLCWIFAMVLLTSCSSEPVKDTTQGETPYQRRQAQVAKPAVKSYGLKDDKGSRRLLNAETLVQSGDSQAAQAELDLINQAELSPEQRGKFNLLGAQIVLSMGDAEQALQQLRQIRPALLAQPDKITYYQSLAFAHSLMGDALLAVSARLKLDNLLQKPEQRQANISAIIDMLSMLPEATLIGQPELAGELKGWMALAKILKQRNQAGVDINERIQQWRFDYPGHAANAEFLQAYLAAPVAADQSEEASPETATPVSEADLLAVLLPASGPYAPAGKAIRQGLEAAYRLAASTTARLPLKFYDSAQDDIVSVYQQAVAEGAKQVIGPLVKEQIQALAANADLSVPVLALNHVENLSQTHLYQFGLSPLDETEALATKAQRDGRRSALVLVPNTSQGQRIGNYLMSSWQSKGGTVAGIQNYDPKQHDIGAMLNQLIASSAYPSGQTPPRAILLSANDDAARELAPQLKYHQADDIAVYAMPTIYAGRPSPVQDAELGSFSFCDMPWLFEDYYAGALSPSALRESLRGLSDAQTRLVALGIDAYNLLEHLPELASTPYAGATGRLGLNGENRITRQLVCAQFKGGVPVASGFAE